MIKQGSMSLAFESERLAVPEANSWASVPTTTNVAAVGRRQNCGWMTKTSSGPKNHAYRYSLTADLGRKKLNACCNGFKMEVESLITKEISYVTETYVPERLASGDFLD